MLDGGLRKLFRAHIPGHWQSIETGGVGRGVPDSNYCINGVEGWVEYKKTKHWKIGSLKPEQVAWIFRRVREGGRVWLAVRRAEDELWLIDGHWIREVAVGGIKSAEEWVRWEGGPSKWNWDEVRYVLTRP